MASRIGKQKVTNFVGGDSTAFLKQSCELYDEVTYEFTNYTSAVITPKGKYVFHSSPNIKKPFHVFQKLKKQIKGSGKIVPDIQNKQISWFHFYGRRLYPSRFEIVDLNSAYATVLHKYGVIDDVMYKLLVSGIPKEDRLSAVGFLGTKKSRVIYRKGMDPEYGTDVSETAPWFFFCCYITGEVMRAARSFAGDDYFFYWVDGIAVRQGQGERVMNYILSLGFPCKVEQVENAVFEDGRLTYEKDGKKKLLFIPKKRGVKNKEAIDFLSDFSFRNSFENKSYGVRSN